MWQRRTATFLVGILVSGFLLWIAVRNVDFTSVVQFMQHARYWAAVPFTLCMVFFYWIRTWRWRILLGPIAAVRVSALFGPVMIGYGANFLLPFQLGEVARSVAAREKTGLRLMPIAFSIVVERLFDFIVILTALALALAVHDELPSWVSHLGIAAGAGVLCLICFTVLFTFRTEAVLGFVSVVVRYLPERARVYIVNQLRSGSRGLQAIRDRRMLLAAAVTSYAQWAVIAVCIWISLYAVRVQAAPETILLILALIVLGSSLPNAPGYLGSIQAGYVVALEATQQNPEQGIAASVFYHVIYAVTAIGMGLIALRSMSLSLRAVAKGTIKEDGSG